MQTFDAILAVLLAAHQGTTYTTSLNPYSKPSGAHIITFSGLTKAWPTDSDLSASSSTLPVPPPPFSFQPGGPIIPACPVVICYFSGSEVFEPTSAWGTLASSAPTASSSVSVVTSPASETSS
ncbi:hypothetical protein BD311DRAFT_823733 [Dichomitus squalens]|uniref:REJ domain-containing protein n=1 Tax=Dichomitus squalens TaxID=114155 RepID=A0A4Q9M8P0_9APHY|nr:hypothetical protein BD311DRAFT_823733 [Dichomitus squalens]